MPKKCRIQDWRHQVSKLHNLHHVQVCQENRSSWDFQICRQIQIDGGEGHRDPSWCFCIMAIQNVIRSVTHHPESGLAANLIPSLPPLPSSASATSRSIVLTQEIVEMAAERFVDPVRREASQKSLDQDSFPLSGPVQNFSASNPSSFVPWLMRLSQAAS